MTTGLLRLGNWWILWYLYAAYKYLDERVRRLLCSDGEGRMSPPPPSYRLFDEEGAPERPEQQPPGCRTSRWRSPLPSRKNVLTSFLLHFTNKHDLTALCCRFRSRNGVSLSLHLGVSSSYLSLLSLGSCRCFSYLIDLPKSLTGASIVRASIAITSKH